MKFIFSNEERFKQKLVNEVMKATPISRFQGLNPISDITDCNTEGVCFIGSQNGINISLKLAIFGNKHQLQWNVRIHRSGIKDINILNKLFSGFLTGLGCGGSCPTESETRAFIEMVNAMQTKVEILKTETEKFLDKHGEKIKILQDKIDQEINEFSETLG